MIELTEELRQAVREQPGTPLRLVDPATQEAFVLLRAEDYDRLMEHDEGPWTDEERDLLRAEALEALGWEGMEAYQDDEP
jgi:PHD/YefM family antitoxin component YafN of YafNO toxin-antitoxin module